MTKYCCPDCPDHPVLNENLECYVCGGKYVWEKKEKENTKLINEKYTKKYSKRNSIQEKNGNNN